MLKLLGLCIAILAIVYFFFFSPFTKIKTLEITGGGSCLPPEIGLEQLNLANKNLPAISKSDLEKVLLKKYPCIRKISINKIFPAKIMIKTELQSEILKIADTNFFLNQDGIVSGSTIIPALPLLYPNRNLNLKVGGKIEDKDVAYALKLTIELAKSDFRASSIRIIDRGSIAVYNTADLIAIFSTKKTAKEQVDSLQLVLSKAKIDAAKIVKIDLRFEKPVLVFK